VSINRLLPPILEETRRLRAQELFETFRTRQLALFFPPENLVSSETDQLVDCWSEWKEITTSLHNHLPFGQYLDEYEVELFIDNKLPQLPGACQEQLLYWHLAAATSSFNKPISHLNITKDESRFWLNHVALRQTLIRQQILHRVRIFYLTRFTLDHRRIEVGFNEIRLITNPRYQDNPNIPEHLFVFVDRKEYTYQWDQEIWETTLDNHDSNLVNPLEYHQAPLGTTNQQFNGAIQIAANTAREFLSRRPIPFAPILETPVVPTEYLREASLPPSSESSDSTAWTPPDEYPITPNHNPNRCCFCQKEVCTCGYRPVMPPTPPSITLWAPGYDYLPSVSR
jgi:hypothetical protein